MKLLEKQESAPSEREVQAATLATEVREDFENQMGGKTFTISVRGQEIQITTSHNMAHKEQALWDSQVPDALFVHGPEKTRNTVIFFSQLLASPEASAMISSIIKKKNIPTDMQAEVRKKVFASGITSKE